MTKISAGKITAGDTITITGGGGGGASTFGTGYTGNGSAGVGGTFTTTGINTISPIFTTSGGTGTISTMQMPKASLDYLLDTYEMNQIVVEHKLQEHELMKLKDADVNFADHIKSNLTKTAAEKIVQKMSFTKIKDPNMDVTSFRGRVWVFTKDELEQLIKDAQNA